MDMLIEYTAEMLHKGMSLKLLREEARKHPDIVRNFNAEFLAAIKHGQFAFTFNAIWSSDQSNLLDLIMWFYKHKGYDVQLECIEEISDTQRQFYLTISWSMK